MYWQSQEWASIDYKIGSLQRGSSNPNTEWQSSVGDLLKELATIRQAPDESEVHCFLQKSRAYVLLVTMEPKLLPRGRARRARAWTCHHRSHRAVPYGCPAMICW